MRRLLNVVPQLGPARHDAALERDRPHGQGKPVSANYGYDYCNRPYYNFTPGTVKSTDWFRAVHSSARKTFPSGMSQLILFTVSDVGADRHRQLDATRATVSCRRTCLLACQIELSDAKAGVLKTGLTDV